MQPITRDLQYWKFRTYGFLKNLRFFDPFLILFLREAGLSFLAIGTLISIREIATNILEIPTGVLADAFGRRKAMLFGFSAYLLSFIVFYLVVRVQRVPALVYCVLSQFKLLDVRDRHASVRSRRDVPVRHT